MAVVERHKIGRFEITNDRFTRKTVPFRITLRSIDQRISEPLRITLSQDLVEKAAIIRTIPTAISAKETLAGTEFSFTSEAQQMQVVITVQPDRFGIFTWKLTIADFGEFSLFEIIYP
jgi:hypothetical protein